MAISNAIRYAVTNCVTDGNKTACRNLEPTEH